MPTGPLHQRITHVDRSDPMYGYGEDCRCMIGEAHDSDGALFRYYDDDEDVDEDDSGERLNVHDAALIWMSSGMDEDQTFGYSESELRRAGGVD